MTEKEKRDNGMYYIPALDEEIDKELRECKDKCFEFNNLKPSMLEEKANIIRNLFGRISGSFLIESPFWCDFGYNIEIGDKFYANHNLVILDGAKVKFGDNVYIAPDCGFYTAGHHMDSKLRNEGYEYAYPITVGSSVWIGAGTRVLPGVTIGSNVVIGAGSVVTKSIPDNCVAYGNPCRVARILD